MSPKLIQASLEELGERLQTTPLEIARLRDALIDLTDIVRAIADDLGIDKKQQ